MTNKVGGTWCTHISARFVLNGEGALQAVLEVGVFESTGARKLWFVAV